MLGPGPGLRVRIGQIEGIGVARRPNARYANAQQSKRRAIGFFGQQGAAMPVQHIGQLGRVWQAPVARADAKIRGA